MAGMTEASPALPALNRLTGLQLAISALSIAAAALLLATLGYRIARAVDVWQWWLPIAWVAGVAAADLASGLVHWGADTWGRDDFPVVGPRLLVPFRVHHVNPDDFLQRPFIDTNGDVALISIPVIVALLAIPLNGAWGPPLAVFGFAFCAIGSMTNQIHQWAHTAAPPRLIAALQSRGMLLGRSEHADHHEHPYDRHYCITTGWCNRPLQAVDFFRRIEKTITAVTGTVPRRDDRHYDARFSMRTSERDTRCG
jgi:ubiquitin-conjugating enzyme E2 variant